MQGDGLTVRRNKLINPKQGTCCRSHFSRIGSPMVWQFGDDGLVDGLVVERRIR